jgi:hypothetical protein
MYERALRFATVLANRRDAQLEAAAYEMRRLAEQNEALLGALRLAHSILCANAVELDIDGPLERIEAVLDRTK